MASTRILSPKPVEMAPAPSLELSLLDQLCSGNLDALLDDACRIASREGSFSKPQAPAANAGKSPAAKASAAKKQVRQTAYRRSHQPADNDQEQLQHQHQQ
jgi:hypothetical protein